MNLRTLINKTLSGAKYIVKEDEVGRPELIALEYYNTDSKTDIILKWNGISDPFALSVGEELEIPHDEVPFYKLDRPRIFEDNKIKNEFVQGKKLSKKDLARIEALKKKYNKEVLLPPNVIAVGKKNFKFTADGNVILGAQAQNDDVTQSIVADLATQSDQLIQDRINQLEGQIDDLQDALAGSGGGSGAGAGSDGLTERQLDKNLANQAGKGGGAGSSGGIGAGTADETGGAAGDGTAPESTGGGTDIANDGAPCN